jgi:hypothetical protein
MKSMTEKIAEDYVRFERQRQSRVINRDYVRRWALDYAKETRSHKFTRVSEYFLNYIERECKNIIMDKVRRIPSKGKTLQ